MKNINIIRNFIFGSFALLALFNSISAAPVVRTASGANAAAIQATVDQFRGGVATFERNLFPFEQFKWTISGSAIRTKRRYSDWFAA